MDVIRSIRDAGHEIGHHGYMHESVRGKDEATEVGYLVRGLEALDRWRVSGRWAIPRPHAT